MALWPSLCTYHSELVGCRAMLEQDVDDVGVPLLCSLVQRRVPVLQAEEKAAAGAAHKATPHRMSRIEAGNSPSFWH